MNTIIVPTDFSESAENAANYASELALELNKEILLFHVIDLVPVYSDVPVTFELESSVEEAKEKIKSQKLDLEKKYAGKIKIHAQVSSGNFFTELEATCGEVKPYLVITGSQGKGALEGFSLWKKFSTYF